MARWPYDPAEDAREVAAPRHQLANLIPRIDAGKGNHRLRLAISIALAITIRSGRFGHGLLDVEWDQAGVADAANHAQRQRGAGTGPHIFEIAHQSRI